MGKKYIGGERPDYLVIDSDSHVDETKVQAWKIFPEHLRGMAPREFVDSTQPDLTEEERNKQINPYLKYTRITVIEHTKTFPNADYRSGPYGFLPDWTPEGEWHNRDGERDATKRLPDMDEEGVDITHIFGSYHQSMNCLIDNPEVSLYWCRGWNDWAAEYRKPDPKRILATALAPLGDVEAGVGETRRAVSELGLDSISMPAQFKREWTWKERFYPIFEECEKLGVPIAMHVNTMFGTGQRRLDNLFYKHIFMGSDCPYSVVGFVASGVLETFPKLRVVWCEQGVGWLPYYMDRLQEHLEMFPGFVPDPKKDPRDYFGDQLFISAEPEEIDYVPFIKKKMGIEGIVLGTDYSHPDSISPRSIQRILDYPELSDDDKKKVLSDNPARLWGISTDGKNGT